MREIGKLLLALILVSISMPGQAASTQSAFDTYRQQQQQDAQKIKKEFQAYKEKQDAEFANFLKSQWREFDTFRGKVRIKEPKPKQVPVALPTVPAKPAEPTPGVPPVAVVPAPPPLPVVPPQPPAPPPPPPPPQPKPVPLAGDVLEISYYGNTLSFPFDQQWKRYRLSGNAKPEAMSEFWTMMSGSNYEPTIKAIETVRSDLKLDDWGYASLWRSVAQALQPGHKAEQNLLLWYFLIKSGYDVRLGYSGPDIHLFVAVRQQVYSTKYTSVGRQTYYALLDADHGNSIHSFFTYEASYPASLKPLDIQYASTAFAKPLTGHRELSFEYKGKTIRLNVAYDRRLVEYVGSFPQTEFPVYFDTDGSAILQHSLLAELKKYTATMSQDEAANFLLAFVQKAFAYKTDEQQFGYEKYFFVEESLYFPYNDCEDRAVLYAWLVHELLGLKVVGLQYPGHMTTAVELKHIKPGYSTVAYQGGRYVIADPTYINAPVGMAMPTYAKLKPNKVIGILYRTL